MPFYVEPGEPLDVAPAPPATAPLPPQPPPPPDPVVIPDTGTVYRPGFQPDPGEPLLTPAEGHPTSPAPSPDPTPAPTPTAATPGPTPVTQAYLDTFVAENSQAVAVADVKLPSAAWADLRDTLVQDLPYVGTHVRTVGRGLRGAVASSLWPTST